MEFKDDEIKRLQLAAESEEKKRFLQNIGNLNNLPKNDGVAAAPETLPEEHPSSLKQIRTFQGDVASALKNQNESLVSIQKSQAIKNDEENLNKNEGAGDTRKKIALIVSIVLFLILGGGAGYITYKHFKTATAPVVISVAPNRFLSVSETKNINSQTLSKESLFSLVDDEKNKKGILGVPGQLVQIELRKDEGEAAPLMTTSEFLILIEARPPTSLVRAFDPLFMLGVNGSNQGSTFLLIKLKSFEQAYPGMLSWEPDMAEDLMPLFTNQNASSTLIKDKGFEDVTISNKDARVLKDSEGKSILLYTFIDNQMVLITDNEADLQSLLNLLAAGKLSR